MEKNKIQQTYTIAYNRCVRISEVSIIRVKQYMIILNKILKNYW